MSSYQTLIDSVSLQRLQQASQPVVVLDCGFDLADTEAGRAAFRLEHVPGARYAHLDLDLSGGKTRDNGRHPLPAREDLARTLARWGIDAGTQVVVYDAQGAPYASRAWWLLRWMGHPTVAVLDGGMAAWRDSGGAVEAGDADRDASSDYSASPTPAMATIDAAELLAQLGHVCLLDARSAERFRGDVEPLDPVAGHIPGATLRCFKDNLAPDGRFKSAADLRAEFDALATPPTQVVHQCGSGVTACHNLLAMEHAGLKGSRLYPGSWSEWCADPARPIAVG